MKSILVSSLLMRLVLFFSVQSSLIYFISRINILVLSEFICISENKKHCYFMLTTIHKSLKVTKAMFGSLEGKGGEGFGGLRLEEKIEKSFKFFERLNL